MSSHFNKDFVCTVNPLSLWMISKVSYFFLKLSLGEKPSICMKNGHNQVLGTQKPIWIQDLFGSKMYRPQLFSGNQTFSRPNLNATTNTKTILRGIITIEIHLVSPIIDFLHTIAGRQNQAAKFLWNGWMDFKCIQILSTVLLFQHTAPSWNFS